MKFFTNPLDSWPYHLIPYHRWKKGYNKEFTELIIDSGVSNLKDKKEYKFIEEYPLQDLPKNVYWVIPDYPFDVGPSLSQNDCIEKSWQNIKKWHHLSNTICSVQYEFENIESFKDNYKKLYPIANIIGIGNLCKSRKLNYFLKPVINFILKNNILKKQIHFFGLFKMAIKHIISLKPDFPISVDSMKWDYGLHGHCVAGTYSNTKEYRWNRFKKYVKDVKDWEIFYSKQIQIEF